MWFTFEKKWNAKTDKDYIEYWKLISSPKYEVVNWHIITLNWKIKRLTKQIEREKPKTFLERLFW